MPGYTIGQLARAADVPVSTLRFYERAGLLNPDARTGGNYRAYSESSLAKLKFIRSAQATGFSLDDVRELLTLTNSEEPPCEEVLALTRKRLGEIRERLKALQHIEKVLASSLDACCTGDAPDLCSALTTLGGKNLCKS